ncbi:MAG: TonB-dependent receptor [Candidatus Aminicenantales bacterium]
MMTLRRISWIPVLVLLVFPFDIEAAGIEGKQGTIRGTVTDADVRSPIPYVEVTIAGTSFKAVTDDEGRFNLMNVPVGVYSLRFSGRFYGSRIETDVVVKSERITFLDVGLRLEAMDEFREEITVSADAFPTTGDSSAGSIGFSSEEIRRAAGSAGDVSRIIGGLPSIARTNDMTNTLVVRGGSPAENAFYLDNIRIPNINHYPTLGSSAGAIGLLNVDFIKDVRFQAGGFSPLFGNRLSSVMDIGFREGNTVEPDFQASLDMMGIGIAAEGPLPKDSGSWLLGIRRSYMDLLIDLMGQGVTPLYGDVQAKVTFKPSARSRLSLLCLAGSDRSGTIKEDAVRDDESFFGRLDTREYTVGLNGFTMLGSSGYSETSLSFSRIEYTSASFHTVSEDLARKGDDSEASVALRNVNVLRLSGRNKLTFGAEIERAIDDYDREFGPLIDPLGNVFPASRDRYSVRRNAFALFVDHAWSPADRLTINLGFRADRCDPSPRFLFSPRLSLNWRLGRRVSFNLAGGVFRQPLPSILLGGKNGSGPAGIPVAYHAVAGFSLFPASDTRLTIEAYRKEYAHLPMDPLQPSLCLFDEAFTAGYFGVHDTILDRGKARSYGLEILLQKKLTGRLHGIIGASLFRSEYRGLDGRTRDRAYDNRRIFTVEGGYKLDRGWELGLKWNYAGGAPYTPFDLEASRAAGTGIFDPSRINGSRLPAYHSLNLRCDKRFNFSGSNLIVYLSIWNAYGRKNAAASYWNTNVQGPGFVRMWGLLPVLGIEFEF